MAASVNEITVVVDVGSSSVKAGFSGEDLPRTVFPSVVAEDLSLATEELSTYRARRPEVLMVEPPLNERAQRQEIAAMMFETFKVPALSVCNSAVLALFASGRTRGLALEVGGGISHAVPVFEGFALNHSVLRLEGAGQDVSHRLKLLLEERGHHLSFDTVRDIKENMCYVSTANGEPPVEYEYELPDGNTIALDSECRGRAAELLFDPAAGGENFRKRATDGGLASMVLRSVSMCDKDINPDLLGSVVVAGGTTVMPGFVERLKEDLDKASFSPDGVSLLTSVIPHPTIREPGYNAQRKHAPWIGGSILASLPPFKQLQVTRQEYEDGGESAIHRIFL